MTLYVVVVECPHCNDKTSFVEETEQPVSLMQDINVSERYCPTCGINVDRLDKRKWIVVEETRIERVEPTEEIEP
jgi:endogenous inhibitor of DNA gyrase (YacG/DUF329 family)